MQERKKITANSPSELRIWLIENHRQQESVWLVRYKKGKGPSYLSYDDLVDELLCFGWVDSVPAKLDDQKSMLLISPRKPSSNWSSINKQKVEKLLAQKRMHDSGLKAVETAKRNGKWDFLNEVEAGIIPDDLKEAFNQYPNSLSFFEKFPFSSKRGILEWIKNAKTADTRARRIQKTAEKASRNLKANHPKGRDLGPPPTKP